MKLEARKAELQTEMRERLSLYRRRKEIEISDRIEEERRRATLEIETKIKQEMNGKKNPKQIQSLKNSRERLMNKYKLITDKLSEL
jgi:hypothetical protein